MTGELVTFTLRDGGNRDNAADYEYTGPPELEAEAREHFASSLEAVPLSPVIELPKLEP